MGYELNIAEGRVLDIQLKTNLELFRVVYLLIEQNPKKQCEHCQESPNSKVNNGFCEAECPNNTFPSASQPESMCLACPTLLNQKMNQ